MSAKALSFGNLALAGVVALLTPDAAQSAPHGHGGFHGGFRPAPALGFCPALGFGPPSASAPPRPAPSAPPPERSAPAPGSSWPGPAIPPIYYPYLNYGNYSPFFPTYPATGG